MLSFFLIISSSLIMAVRNGCIYRLLGLAGMELNYLDFPRIACYKFASILDVPSLLDAIIPVERTLGQLLGQQIILLPKLLLKLH